MWDKFKTLFTNVDPKTIVLLNVILIFWSACSLIGANPLSLINLLDVVIIAGAGHSLYKFLKAE